jgi:hypothetical protein
MPSSACILIYQWRSVDRWLLLKRRAHLNQFCWKNRSNATAAREQPRTGTPRIIKERRAATNQHIHLRLHKENRKTLHPRDSTRSLARWTARDHGGKSVFDLLQSSVTHLVFFSFCFNVPINKIQEWAHFSTWGKLNCLHPWIRLTYIGQPSCTSSQYNQKSKLIEMVSIIYLYTLTSLLTCDREDKSIRVET